jgi:hypothetical protein
MSGINLKQDLKQLDRVAGRAGSDTIRLWEGYKEQAFFWRALALIQVPSTALAIGIALVMYFLADTIIEVPEHPQPGFYSVKQLPDSQFINVSREVVNLISTYQPAVARRQFKTARKYLWEPALSQFETVMLQGELNAIEGTKRSQMFFINPRLIQVVRSPEDDTVAVRIPGIRQKLIGDKPLAPDELVYYIKMTTIPRNVHNEYGIVVTDIHLRAANERVLNMEDNAVNSGKAKQERANQQAAPQ